MEVAMKKKNFIVPLLIFSVAFFVQCSDDPVEPANDHPAWKAGGNGGGGGGGNGGGGGGGGHTEVAGNNLSFPALLADGYALTPVTPPLFTVVYAGDYTGLTAEQIAFLIDNGPWYPQQTEGNTWQADYETASGPTDIDWIDWGDAIEAVNPKLGRPYRLELSIYVTLETTLTGYTMAELEFPSSQDELQGTNTSTYEGDYAAVASPKGRLVVQRTEGVDPSTLVWNEEAGKWDGAEAPETGFGFGVENNVGGKLIYGTSLKGWKPDQLGAYRITFDLYASDVSLVTALIGNYAPTGFIEVIQGETNTPVVDMTNDLTYVDVTVVAGGGGGGGH